MKVGLIRCLQTEDMCGGTMCYKAMREKFGAFEGADEITLINVNTCGGCPGKKAVTRAARMVRSGADTIVLASCISKGTPVGFPCPYKEHMEKAIRAKVGPDVTILTYSH